MSTIKQQVDTLIADFKKEFDILDEVDTELLKCSSESVLADIVNCLDEFTDRLTDFEMSIRDRIDTIENGDEEDDGYDEEEDEEDEEDNAGN